MIYALHGFLGDPTDWNSLQTHLRARQQQSFGAPNLWEAPFNRADFSALPAILSQDFFERSGGVAIEDSWLWGYSMGGRILLNWVLSQKLRPRGIVLLSGGLGLKHEAERFARIAEDERWAERFESDSNWDWVLADWTRQPIFLGDKQEPSVQIGRRMAYGHALRAWSLGGQENYRSRLHELACPVLAFSGKLDPKYKLICEDLVRLAPQARHVEIQGAGHRLLKADARVIGEMAGTIDAWMQTLL